MCGCSLTDIGSVSKSVDSGKPSAAASLGCCLSAAMTTEAAGLEGKPAAVSACDAVRLQGLQGCRAGPGSVSCDMTCDTGLPVAGLTACDAACCTAFGMDCGEGRPTCIVSFVMLLGGRA